MLRGRAEPPLWELLDKSLTAEQQQQQVKEFNKIYKQLPAPTDTSSEELKQLLLFYHLVTLQCELAAALSSWNLLAIIGCMFLMAITHFDFLEARQNVSAKDIFAVALFVAFLSPILPLLLTVRKESIRYILFACYLFSAFTRSQPKTELITSSDIVVLAATLLSACLLPHPVSIFVFVNLSLWLFVWNDINSKRTNVGKFICATAVHVMLLLSLYGVTETIVFAALAIGIVGICRSVACWQFAKLQQLLLGQNLLQVLGYSISQFVLLMHQRVPIQFFVPEFKYTRQQNELKHAANEMVTPLYKYISCIPFL